MEYIVGAIIATFLRYMYDYAKKKREERAKKEEENKGKY